MANIYNVDPAELIEKIAEELKKIDSIKPPEWALFVKTGVSRERPPFRNDWWYIRAASILRNTYKLGPIGVSKLRTGYGGKKNRGVRPEKFYRASGNIIRKAMQQLAKAGLIQDCKKGVHKGKIISSKGNLLLSKAAESLLKSPKGEKELKEKKSAEFPKNDKKKDINEKDIKSKDKGNLGKEEPKKESVSKSKQEKVPSSHELAAKKINKKNE